MEGRMSSVPQPPPVAPTAEDAATEGGEAVATFSPYHPPSWASELAAQNYYLPPTESSSFRTTTTTSDPEVIVIDGSDAENEPDMIPTRPNSDPMEEPSATATITTTTSSAVKKSSHTSPACESGLLASVAAPEPSKECLTVISQLVKEGRLSALQAEGSGLAIQRHCRLLKRETNTSDNHTKSSSSKYMRAGFFLGDGAGVGKGRQISAVIRDSFSRSVKDASQGISSRRRHLWISVSRELIEDAKRDLEDVGCYAPVLDGAELLSNHNGKKNGKNDQSGVLFITYPLLISGKGSKMEEIISWLTLGQTEESFNGCIIFDEAHKAKNLCADPPTATGLLVTKLQERLSNARVMYCSATGVSDLKQMGYATRLGLWGPGTNFKNFDVFRASLEKRGVGSMELLALEMKQAGCFVARTLSWDGAEFQSVKVKLSPEYIDVYDRSMKWWSRVKDEIKDALARPEMRHRPPKMLWSHYWSALQRFSKEIAISAKVPEVAKDALLQLENGHSVVIGLQSTGESSAQMSLEELEKKLCATGAPVTAMDEVDLDKLLSTSEAIMTSFLRNHFPVAPLPPEPIDIPPVPEGGFQSADERMMYAKFVEFNERIRNQPPPEPIHELVVMRSNLLSEVSTISLPPAPLDDLIDRLGGPENVAEMTGRSGRCVRIPNSNKFRYRKRVKISSEKKFGLSMQVSEDDTDCLNIIEKKKFMDGKKRVAVISDAASTGISLHAASNSKASDRRRIHYTIELPWAADKAIQQLGRTHRSGQVSAPIYKMVVTDLGGERRFAAAVAKRMANLGALTKGDRRAATGSDLSEFNVDSRFGRRALKRFYDCVGADTPYTPSKGSNAIIDAYSSSNSVSVAESEFERRQRILNESKESIISIGIDPRLEAKKGEVKVFLNRIAALSVKKQNLVFSLFTSTMDDVIAAAKATGEFEGSVEDIRATTIELSSKPKTLTFDTSSGAETNLATFRLDRGCSLSHIAQMCIDMIPESQTDDKAIECNDSVAKSGIYVSKNRISGRYLVLFAKRKIQLTEDDEDENRIDCDPLGLMVITRPNTGTNPYEKTTKDLSKKYRQIASLDEIISAMGGSRLPEDLVQLIGEKFASFCQLWNEAFEESNALVNENGLAPRCSELGIVTGAVLHCLLALEMSVSMRSLQDRSLKIIRVETSNDGKRHIGMKYPVDEEALRNLDAAMKALNESRKGISSASTEDFFIDEAPESIQRKSVDWLTTAPKTMQSFFATANKRKQPPVGRVTPLQNKKGKTRRGEIVKVGKTKSITSFFKKPSF